MHTLSTLAGIDPNRCSPDDRKSFDLFIAESVPRVLTALALKSGWRWPLRVAGVKVIRLHYRIHSGWQVRIARLHGKESMAIEYR